MMRAREQRKDGRSKFSRRAPTNGTFFHGIEIPFQSTQLGRGIGDDISS